MRSGNVFSHWIFFQSKREHSKLIFKTRQNNLLKLSEQKLCQKFVLVKAENYGQCQNTVTLSTSQVSLQIREQSLCLQTFQLQSLLNPNSTCAKLN